MSESSNNADERYGELVDSLPQIVYEIDPETRIMLANSAALRRFGYTEDDLAGGLLLRDLVAEEDRDRVLERVRLMPTEATPSTGVEFTAVQKDGTRFRALAYGCPIIEGGEIRGLRVIVVDVSAIRHTERQLVESEERYARLIETMADGLVSVDRDGVIRYVNRAFVRMVGYEADELKGLRFHELCTEESTWILKKQLQRRFNDGLPASYELELITCSGTRLPVHVNATPLRNDVGEIYASLGVFTDISEQKAREEWRRLDTQRLALLNSLMERLNAGDSIDAIIAEGADRLRGILDAHHVDIMLRRPGHGTDHTVVSYSNMPEELLVGLRDDSSSEPISFPILPGLPMTTVYETSRFQELSGEKVKEALAQLQPHLHPELPVSASELTQRLRLAYLCMAPMILDGEVIGHVTLSRSEEMPLTSPERRVLATFAEEMAAIVGKARTEQALKRANQFLRGIVDNAAVWFTVVDEKREVVIWNRAAEAISGYDRSEVRTARDAMCALYPDPNDRKTVYAQVNDIYETGQTAVFDSAISCKDGRRRVMQWHMRPLDPTVEGARGGMIVVGIDITRRLELQEQLQRAQRLEAIGTLAGGVAHDFNNLLTAILGHADLLQSDAGDEGSVRWHAEQIQKGSQRAARLTRQLLTFSRKHPAQPQTLNLNHVIAGMRDILRRLIREDIELVFDLDEDLGNTRIDPAQAEQIVMNLAVNARDAMPEGGELIISTRNAQLSGDDASELFETEPGDYVVLEFADTGVGMTPEVERRIFEPFFTTKEETGGTGLGLSTVYGIVRQNHGAVLVDSEPGAGTTFRVCLPRAETGAVSEPTVSFADQHRLEGTETVMIVEDADNLRALVEKMLDTFGYKVLSASDGPEALEIAAKYGGPIDVLVTDVVMPEMSGTDLAERFIVNHPEAQVLYISGYPTDHAVTAHQRDPRFNFLQKPFSAVELGQRLRTIIKRAAKRDDSQPGAPSGAG